MKPSTHHLPPTPRLPALALLLAGFCAGTAAAKEIYVATNGTASAPYATWATALPDVQRALNYASPGDTIYLAGHTFEGGIPGTPPAHPYNAFLIWQHATNVTIRGGYDAIAGGGSDPGARSSTTTVKRTEGSVRVLTMIGITNCTVERVTIREGYGAGTGTGVFLTNCWDVSFSSCLISGNTNNGGYGTGMRLARSSVVLTNCTVSDNDNPCQYSGGTGLYVDGSSRLTAIRSFFLRNTGANQAGNGNRGMAFLNDGVLNLIETVVSENKTTAADGSLCGGGYNAGLLTMRNCLVISNRTLQAGAVDGLYLAAGTATLVNCTFATNYARGIQYAGGTLAMTNCIVRGHSVNDLVSVPLGNVWYSGIGDGQNNGIQGCTSIDPLFADTTYYHLKSSVSNYTGGYFSGGTWAAAAADSPLIDSGDPKSTYSREPAPNGSRINMGYDGNTEVASPSYIPPDRAPTVANPGATLGGHRSAVLNGQVTDTGYPKALAYFRYWAVGSATTSETSRAEQLSTFNATVASLIPGTSYQYLVVASNRVKAVLSGVASFSTHPTPSYLYVATNGNNTAGTNWGTAYTAVPTALNLAEPNDTIYLAGQTFVGGIGGTVPAHPANAFLIWQHATNITVRGGYDAVAGGGSDPGTRNSVTEWKRTVGSVRVLSMIGLTNCTVEQVTIRDGRTHQGGGGGVYLTNCRDVTFASCVVSNNGGGWGYGLGMYLNNSSVVLTNTTIANNIILGEAWSSGGGGIYIDPLSRMTAVRSSVKGNGFPESSGNWSSGGGIAVGGALNLYECVVSGNMGGTATSGGGIYNTGLLAMRNCLMYSNICLAANNVGYGANADALFLVSGTATVVNCTIASNNTIGMRYVGGVAAITNCIIWGHSIADLTNFPKNAAGVLNNVAYSAFAIPAAMKGVNGCLNQNPLFVHAAANDYRLQETPCSPCINKGENQPWMANATDLDGAPRVQGGTADMGAFEYSPNPPTIRHSSVTNLTAKSATVGAEIVSVGGSAAAAVLLFHGPADGGTDPQAWASQIRLPVLRAVGGVTATIPMGSTNALCFYRFCATNSFGAGWAAATGAILLGALDVGVTRRESTEEKPAAFVISRPATAKNGPLSVYFTLGGTGVNGADYEPLESPAVIPKGAAEVRLPVVPKFNLGDQQPKSVELTLAPGGYVIGVKKSARILTRAE